MDYLVNEHFEGHLFSCKSDALSQPRPLGLPTPPPFFTSPFTHSPNFRLPPFYFIANILITAVVNESQLTFGYGVKMDKSFTRRRSAKKYIYIGRAKNPTYRACDCPKVTLWPAVGRSCRFVGKWDKTQENWIMCFSRKMSSPCTNADSIIL